MSRTQKRVCDQLCGDHPDEMICQMCMLRYHEHCDQAWHTHFKQRLPRVTLNIPDFNDFFIRFQNCLKKLKFDFPEISKLNDLFNNVLISLQLLIFDDAFQNRNNYPFQL